MKKGFKQCLIRILLLFACCQIVLGGVWLGHALFAPMETSPIGGGALYQVMISVFASHPVWYRFLSILVILIGTDFFLNQLATISLPLRVIRVLWVMSFPMVLMQTTVVAPYALAGSLLLVLVGFCIAYKKNSLSEKTALAGAGSTFLLLCLWLPEGLLFGLLPLAYMLVLWCRQKGMLWKRVCLFLFVCLLGAGSAFWGEQLPKNSEDVKPIEEMMLARMARLHIANLAGRYPEEVLSFINRDILGEVGEYPERLEEKIIEPMNEKYGKSQARAYMKAMALSNYDAYAWVIKHEVAKDFGCYLTAPAVNTLRLCGYSVEGRSRTNYQNMLDANARGLTLLSFWSTVGFVCSLCIGFCYVCYAMIRKMKEVSYLPVLLLELLLMAGWYTLQSGGTMDERKVLFVPVVWIGCFCMALQSWFSKETGKR